MSVIWWNLGSVKTLTVTMAPNPTAAPPVVNSTTMSLSDANHNNKSINNDDACDVLCSLSSSYSQPSSSLSFSSVIGIPEKRKTKSSKTTSNSSSGSGSSLTKPSHQLPMFLSSKYSKQKNLQMIPFMR